MGYLSATVVKVETVFSFGLLSTYDAEWCEAASSVTAKWAGIAHAHRKSTGAVYLSETLTVREAESAVSTVDSADLSLYRLSRSSGRFRPA